MMDDRQLLIEDIKILIEILESGRGLPYIERAACKTLKIKCEDYLEILDSEEDK